MRKRRVHSIQLETAALILTVSAFLYNAFAVDIGIEVLFDPAIAVIPVIDNDKIMYQDFQGGKYKFITHTLTGTQSVVRDNGSAYMHPFDFGGTLVAWIEYTATYGGIAKTSGPSIPADSDYFVKARKLSSGSEPTITSNVSYKEGVATDGNYVVWTDYRYFSAGDTTIELYLYDASGSGETRLTNQSGYKAQPMVHGNAVVWQDYRDGNADIYYATLPGGQETAICTESSYQAQPSMDGDIIVWQDYRNAGGGDNADIYMYDRSTGQTTVVCDNTAYQAYPRVYGDYIVWHDYRNVSGDDQNADIYLYEISSKTEQAVTTKAGYQGKPYLDGENIVWYDYTDGKVYRAEIGAATVGLAPAPARAAEFGAEGRSARRTFYDLRGRAVSMRSNARGVVLEKNHVGTIRVKIRDTEHE